MGDLPVRTVALLLSSIAAVAPLAAVEHQWLLQGDTSPFSADDTQALESLRSTHWAQYGALQSEDVAVFGTASQAQVVGLTVTDVDLEDPEVEWRDAEPDHHR